MESSSFLAPSSPAGPSTLLLLGIGVAAGIALVLLNILLIGFCLYRRSLPGSSSSRRARHDHKYTGALYNSGGNGCFLSHGQPWSPFPVARHFPLGGFCSPLCPSLPLVYYVRVSWFRLWYPSSLSQSVRPSKLFFSRTPARSLCSLSVLRFGDGFVVNYFLISSLSLGLSFPAYPFL